MRICLVTHSLPPYIGGCETYVWLLAAGLHENGHDVTVVSEPVAGGAAKGRMYPFRVIGVPGFREFDRGNASLTAIVPPLRAALLNGSFDVIHVHKFLPGLACAVVLAEEPAKVVFTFHSHPDLGSERSRRPGGQVPAETSYAKFVLGLPFYRYVVCPCRHYGTWATAMGVADSKVRVVYPGIDVGRFRVSRDSRLRGRLGFRADDFVVLCAARMSERKGILDLLRAMEHITDGRIRVWLVGSSLSGSKDYADSVKRSIREHRLEQRVRLSLEKYDCFDMPQVLASCDAFVLPSYGEGLPLAILEAMAAGIPTIGSRTAGVDEIISDGANGLLTGCGEPEALAERLEALASDSSLAKKLAEGGLETVQTRFEAGKQIAALEAVYAG